MLGDLAPPCRSWKKHFCPSCSSDRGAQTCAEAPARWCVCPLNTKTAPAWEQWGGWCWSPSTSSSPVGLGGPDSHTSPEWTSGAGRLQALSQSRPQSILQSLMYLCFAPLAPGEGLQNGTTRRLVTCVLTKRRWSAPLFSPRIRRTPKPRSNPPGVELNLGSHF